MIREHTPLVALAAVCLTLSPALAGTPIAKKVAETKSPHWERIETWELTSKEIREETYHELTKLDEKDIVAGFGGDTTPPVRRFLLHVQKPEELAVEGKASRDTSVPVLLVHGAMVNATVAWADGAYHTPGRTGLAIRLARLGYKVFAITFAHSHGDNDTQAEQLAAAIDRVRELTKAPKVDVIAHSKGTHAARLYASSVRVGLRKFTKYRGDIRRLVLIGGPLGGLDINFAYPNLNYLIIGENHNAPVCWTRAMVNYVWKDMGELCMVSPKTAFRGQAQLLGRWDQVYGLIRIKGQFDIPTTYKGGAGLVTISPGIDKAIAAGGDMVAKLAKAGVDKDIEVALLAGSYFHVIGYLGERRGPSDGVLLVRSALMSEAVTARGAKVIRSSALALNHLELTYDDWAVKWIDEVLVHSSK